MRDDLLGTSKRALDPIDRVSEVLFGLIMVLGFTGSLSVAEVGRDDVRTMLVGALGCNLAWGLIDGILYLMGCLAERARGLFALRAVRQAGSPDETRRVIAGALPPVVASVLEPADIDMLGRRLRELPEPPRYARLQGEDWRGATGVCLLVFLSTLPVVIPFTFMTDSMLALRISNTIAVAMLFVTGYTFGRITGRRPWATGASMVVLGLVLVSVTMALGG